MHTDMTTDEYEDKITPNEEQNNGEAQEVVPVGIARIREEWRAAGLVEKKVTSEKEEVEPVLFPEVDGGAGIGDYTLECGSVRDRLALSQEAIDRLVETGEIDSILVQGPDGQSRRLLSESSVNRFQEDSAIDPDAIRRVAKAMADKSIAEAIQGLQTEIEDVRDNQGKILQQMKDMLLLEIRNLKEQDRDLTSFVYELAEEIRQTLPKKKR